MEETRTHVLLKEETFRSRTETLKSTLANQYERIDKNITDLLEAIRLLANSKRFDKVCDDPITELKLLRETAGIVEYHNKFKLLSSRANLSEEDLVIVFLEGLRMDTQSNVRMFQPQTIRQCLMLGRLYETAHPEQHIVILEKNKATPQNSLFDVKDELEMENTKEEPFEFRREETIEKRAKQDEVVVDKTEGKPFVVVNNIMKKEAYVELGVKNIQEVCNLFEPIYNKTEAKDGCVSVKACKSLNNAVNHRNVCMRMPADIVLEIETAVSDLRTVKAVKLGTMKEEKQLALQAVDGPCYEIKDHVFQVWHRWKNKKTLGDSLTLLQHWQPHASAKLLWLLLQNEALSQLSWVTFAVVKDGTKLQLHFLVTACPMMIHIKQLQ